MTVLWYPWGELIISSCELAAEHELLSNKGAPSRIASSKGNRVAGDLLSESSSDFNFPWSSNAMVK